MDVDVTEVNRQLVRRLSVSEMFCLKRLPRFSSHLIDTRYT